MKLRRGFTLIEVVAGLILMATIMSTAMVAFNRHRKQAMASQRILVASQLADATLQQLSELDEGVPESSSGIVAGQPTWRWQTQWIGLAKPAEVDAAVIRFTIQQEDGRELVRVDLFKPLTGADE
jgi:prepilin-type N-terminal cleavage/methylation domain-containing protein